MEFSHNLLFYINIMKEEKHQTTKKLTIITLSLLVFGCSSVPKECHDEYFYFIGDSQYFSRRAGVDYERAKDIAQGNSLFLVELCEPIVSNPEKHK